MEYRTLLKANIKRHKGSLIGIFVLLMLVSVSLTTVLTVWNNSGSYVRGEMSRLGFGDLTAWVSNLTDEKLLTDEISSLKEVDSVGAQEIIFSEYEIGDQESDSEGQLITYNSEQYPYKIFTEDLTGYQSESAQINPGEIYVSPSLCSMFDVSVGDTVTFPIARNGMDKTFTVKGYFEDPFMGSSMIGMKSFLICGQDHDEIANVISRAGNNGLARAGYMLHIFQREDNGLSTAQFSVLLNENTRLQTYVEFTHSREAISGFMLTLQNVFTGFLLAFVVILVLVSMVVLSHSIGSAVEQDYKNMGILKTIGFTSGKLRKIQLLQYSVGILGGMVTGTLLSLMAAKSVCQMTVTTTGLLIPSVLPGGLCLSALVLILLLLSGFIWMKTGEITKVSPMKAIREDWKVSASKSRTNSPIHQNGLAFWMAVRQLLTGKRKYISTCMTAILLVFFASMIGRVNAWLGPNGEGLMDAFNPADLHIAAQPVGEAKIEDVEQTIQEYTTITDQYMLAMPGVSVNGIDYTANVITEPERFHMLEGQTCKKPDEVVLTEFVATDLGVVIGDTVTVASSLGTGEYKVTGIYQCANDMGANIGMNREGFGKIGADTPRIWCVHYFIEDPDLQPEIIRTLEAAYGGDVYLHENSWPGLAGILSAMKMLMIFLYVVVLLFVVVVTLLTAEKLLTAEQKDLGVYKSLGFSAWRLRRSFVIRFGLTSLSGSLLGMTLSAWATDPLVAVLMRMEGISNFSSHPGLGTVLFPGIIVILLFSGFAWLASGKIRKRICFIYANV